MKKILLALICIMYSITGISQAEWTETSTDVEIVTKPFQWACDSVQWPQEWGSDCICDASYYMDTITVSEGSVLNSINITVLGNSTNHPSWGGPNFKYYSYSQDFQGDIDGDTKNTTPGVSIVNLETGETVFIETRYNFSQSITNFSANFEIGPGTYVVYVINESLLDSVYWEPNDHCFDNFVGFCVENYSYYEWVSSELSTQGESWLKPGEEQDMIIGNINYDFNMVTIDNDIQESYSACDGESLTFEAGCVGGEFADEYSYLLEWRVPGTELWYFQTEFCEFTEVFEYDTASTEALNFHEYRYTNYYSFQDSIVTYFDVTVHPNPYWSYTADVESFSQLGDDLLFTVVIPEESQNYLNTQIDSGYNWSVNNSFNGANLELGVGPGGFSCDFTFSPFETQEDTVGSFLVDVTLNTGCSTLDTTYVVYVDINGDGAWDPGDSIQFKSFYIVDTTDIHVQELFGKNMRMYPNPTNNILTLEHDFAGSVSLRIYNAVGDLLRDEQITSQTHQTSVGDLENGIYIIMLSDGNETLTSRLVKME